MVRQRLKYELKPQSADEQTCEAIYDLFCEGGMADWIESVQPLRPVKHFKKAVCDKTRYESATFSCCVIELAPKYRNVAQLCEPLMFGYLDTCRQLVFEDICLAKVVNERPREISKEDYCRTLSKKVEIYVKIFNQFCTVGMERNVTHKPEADVVKTLTRNRLVEMYYRYCSMHKHKVNAGVAESVIAAFHLAEPQYNTHNYSYLQLDDFEERGPYPIKFWMHVMFSLFLGLDIRPNYFVTTYRLYIPMCLICLGGMSIQTFVYQSLTRYRKIVNSRNGNRRTYSFILNFFKEAAKSMDNPIPTIPRKVLRCGFAQLIRAEKKSGSHRCCKKSIGMIYNFFEDKVTPFCRSYNLTLTVLRNFSDPIVLHWGWADSFINYIDPKLMKSISDDGCATMPGEYTVQQFLQVAYREKTQLQVFEENGECDGKPTKLFLNKGKIVDCHLVD